MKDPVTIVLSGIGGYGQVYLDALLFNPKADFRIKGAADPEPERCEHLEKLKEMGIPVYSSLEEFYERHKADLAVLSAPIHMHCPQTCLALEHGSHVLCEKPAAALVEEVDRMIEARDRAGKFVAIGYQWSFSSSIQALKADIMKGEFGEPVRMRSLCLWPRDESYYKRNSWAGRIKDDQGTWVLDSPVNNAMAHDLHNMFFVLGPEPDRSAAPARITAELYRANPIESFDTAALRMITDRGTEILFFGSHAVAEEMGPVFSFEFGDAVVAYKGGAAPMEAIFTNGRVKRYPYPGKDGQIKKLWTAIEAVKGEGTIPCGLEASRAHTLCVNGARESMLKIKEFPEGKLRESGDPGRRIIYVEGLEKVLGRCFNEGMLPSDLGIEWSSKGKKIGI